MANRNFTENNAYSFSKGFTVLTAKFTVGATGAPTLVAASSKGIASIARTAAGTYTLTLDDTYNELLGMNFTLIDAGAEDLTFQVNTEDVDGAKTISFYCNTGGTATDPASGDTIRLMVFLKNSGV